MTINYFITIITFSSHYYFTFNHKSNEMPKKSFQTNERWERVIDGILSRKMTNAQAYIAAGYQPQAAEVKVSQLLKKPKFRDRLAQRSEIISKKADITVERLLEEESRIAYSDFRELFKGDVIIPPSQMPDDAARAVREFDVNILTLPDGSTKTTYKYRFWSKDKALERLERHKGMFDLDNAQKATRIFINAMVIKKGDDT